MFKTLNRIVCALGLSAALTPAAHAIVVTGTDADYLNLGSTYSSVGQIYGTDASSGFAASGVMIAPGWVLTAGHVTAGATSLTFYMDGGGNFGSFSSRTGYAADAWYSYPKWDGNLGGGYDIGLFHLAGDIGCTACYATRYTGTGEIGTLATLVGYGMTGTGETGAVTFDGLKRAGQNMIDVVLQTPGRSNRVLLADFDSGLAADNSWGSMVPEVMEALIAPGDSGGGLFQTIGGIEYLTGINSFGWGLIDGDPNADYGDASGFTRITYFNAWIDDIIGGSSGGSSGGGGGGNGRGKSGHAFAANIATVPEPATVGLMALAIAALGLSRRKRSD